MGKIDSYVQHLNPLEKGEALQAQMFLHKELEQHQYVTSIEMCAFETPYYLLIILTRKFLLLRVLVGVLWIVPSHLPTYLPTYIENRQD